VKILVNLMRGWQLILMALVLSGAVFAQECTDTDKGGSKGTDAALGEKGEVKYGLTTQVDTCLTSEDGVSVAESFYLKEYFCQDGERKSDVYDCSKRGYDKCKDGECVGGSGGSSSGTGGTGSTPAPVSSCGNKIREKDKGEECDPPNDICFGKTTQEYGTCQADCTCKIAEAALKNIRELPPECGDGYKHPDEDCEEDSDCTIESYICSSCKCVKELSPEEIEAMKQEALAKKETEKEEIVDKIDEEFKAPPLPEVDLTAKNFSDEPGIKATSGFANFFKKIFAWLAGIFS
jgi:hypothetical protein